MNQPKSLLANLPLFVVIFIDGMGLSLLFPILNSIIVDPVSHFLSASTSTATRDFLYGLVVSVFMLCWFFGAAILGDLSDKVGRKISLIICLVGAFLGYLLSAVAIVSSSLTLLIIGRVIAGFTAGSQPIAQAAIVDISAPEHKARNIGLILLSVSLGFVFGPIIGGVLSEPKIVSWFNFQTPMYFAAAISLLNAAFLWLTFHETHETKGKLNIRFHYAINIFISAFKHKGIRYLSLVFLVMIFGWSNYFTFISMYMITHYKATPLQVSLFLAVMGCGFAVGCGVLVDYLTKRYSLKNLVVQGSIIAAIGILLSLCFEINWLPWVMTFFIAIAIAIAYSVILTIFSNQVDDNEQGWVMGVTGSIMALCFGITSLLTGAIASYGAGLPIGLGAVGLGLSGVLMFFSKR
ncbi:MAG: MFS transporter [Coxiellaceae bacterium]|nr:MFS transporter [Coxiellaceae bacterium]